MAIHPGEQTERRGEAWPVRALLGGRTSLARFLKLITVLANESRRSELALFAQLFAGDCALLLQLLE